jgi:hypothetical protein
MPRPLSAGVVTAALLLLAPPAAAQAPGQDPPKMPDSTRGAKACGTDVESRFGGHFRVYITKGNRRVSCRRARAIVRKHTNVRGWRYFDWTKGGNGPWSDVWQRRDRRAVVGAIIRCVEGRDRYEDLPPCHETNPR